jgi:ATP-dependent helicase/nuclease subunit A
VIRETEGFGLVEIAEPAGWEEMQARESEFDEAEMSRLLYVAATRARDMLVVSVWKQGKSENAQGPWSALAPLLPEEFPEAAAPASEAPAPPLESIADELAAFRAEAIRRRASAAAPTYAVETVTNVAHAAGEKPAWESTGRGLSWGRVLHAALEAAMRDPTLDLRLHAANLLAAEERSAGEVDEVLRAVEAVRSSPLWTRALAAKRTLVEVPFALPVDRKEAGLGDGPQPTVLQGVIDLVFEEEDGWILVDYKSDTVTPANRAALEAFYAPQIAHYRRYWERLTGRPTRAGLLFVATGELAMLPEPSMSPSHAS